MQNVKCKIKRGIVTLFLVMTGWLFAVDQGVSAAVYFVESGVNAVKVGQTIEIQLRVDTEDKRINVFNVTLEIPEGLELKEIVREQSAVNIWVQEPNFDKQSRKLTFIGGVPGGASGNLILLGLRLQPRSAGVFAINILPESEAYLNDGFGTPVEVQMRGMVLKVNRSAIDSVTVGLVSLMLVIIGLGITLWQLWHKKKIQRRRLK